MRDVNIDETMNSVGLGGRRITLERVTVTPKIEHVGSSKPAEFASNGDQILLDRCAVNANNVWFAATGAEHSGPIVFLNCAFRGNGRIEGHMRWTTGMLLDNCRAPKGGMDFKNRGAMGSGHGWGMGWDMAWKKTMSFSSRRARSTGRSAASAKVCRPRGDSTRSRNCPRELLIHAASP
ncbi:MAG TPA: hypothetical protein VNN22_21610 [Verrucomicrobiae bacterium]|nr:hypothetical protein [Verrucomicrobiae bacterium]